MVENIFDWMCRKTFFVFELMEDGMYVSKIARLGPSLSDNYAWRVVQIFKREKLLTTKKVGRISKIKLTKKGRLIKKHFTILRMEIKEIENAQNNS